jgi:hypothetical protein
MKCNGFEELTKQVLETSELQYCLVLVESKGWCCFHSFVFLFNSIFSAV